MKRTLEKGQDKIQEICDILRHKTIQPAQDEAHKILEEARKKAAHLIQDAQKHAELVVLDARRLIEQERSVFHSSLAQASKQCLEALRQSIEEKLMNPELHDTVVGQTTDPKVIANLITAMIKAIEKEGLAVDFAALIPASVSVKEVNQLLAENILNKLKTKSVMVGEFAGGAKLRLEGKRMTLDISDAEIEGLLRQYIRKDFRKLLFGNSD